MLVGLLGRLLGGGGDVRPVEARHLREAIDNLVDLGPHDVGGVTRWLRLEVRRRIVEQQAPEWLQALA